MAMPMQAQKFEDNFEDQTLRLDYIVAGDSVKQTFRRDGTCTQTLIVTDKNGKEQRRVVNMRWAFYDQSSSTIYFGSDHYWDIEELTTKKFAIYDRWGEYGEINMSREYKEFTPLE